MSWEKLVIDGVEILVAAKLMRCRPETAMRRLEAARTRIIQRRQCVSDAASLLTQSGYRNIKEQPAPSRRGWQDVALGIKTI